MTYHAFTVIDADTNERFSTTDYCSDNGAGIVDEQGAQDRAERERNRLALRYGKEFCLRVAGIDQDGNLHEIEA